MYEQHMGVFVDYIELDNSSKHDYYAFLLVVFIEKVYCKL